MFFVIFVHITKKRGAINTSFKYSSNQAKMIKYLVSKRRQIYKKEGKPSNNYFNVRVSNPGYKFSPDIPTSLFKQLNDDLRSIQIVLDYHSNLSFASNNTSLSSVLEKIYIRFDKLPENTGNRSRIIKPLKDSGFLNDKVFDNIYETNYLYLKILRKREWHFYEYCVKLIDDMLYDNPRMRTSTIVKVLRSESI